MGKLRKCAVYTDIHFGKKANSVVHNQDCLDFITWFCTEVKKDPEIDHIMFLGDWNETRSALNIETLNFSYQGAKMLDRMGMPVFFVVGNHDLYHRHTREIHSVVPFNEFKNFHVIDEPTIVDDIGNGGTLICPYLFHEEYSDLVKYLNYETWWGHFEFQGFMVTGYGVIMPTGPDPRNFKGPKHIFSGHFHKRQSNNNIHYIGNAFPMDFGDAGDNERGYITYSHDRDEVLFFNWDDCPKYIKTTLTDLLDNTVELLPNSRVKCIVDIPVSFEESAYLRQKFMEDYKLREFSPEESMQLRQALSDTEVDVEWEEDGKIRSVNELVIQMLREIDSDHVDNQKLVDIYQKL